MSSGFSSRISQLRKSKKISQRRAAAELGISQALLSHYENGLREPKLDFVVKLCDYYGVSADYLLGRCDITGDRRDMEELCHRVQQLYNYTSTLLNTDSGSGK